MNVSSTIRHQRFFSTSPDNRRVLQVHFAHTSEWKGATLPSGWKELEHRIEECSNYIRGEQNVGQIQVTIGLA